MITEEQIKELAAELTLEEQIVLDSLTKLEERLAYFEDLFQKAISFDNWKKVAEAQEEQQRIKDGMAQISKRISLLTNMHNVEYNLNERLKRIEANLGIESTPKK